MERLGQALELLNQVSEDRTVPKNIRKNSESAADHLKNEELELSVRVDRAIQLLDEISEDPNMPAYTRTQIWSIVSLLESMLSK